MPDLIVSTTEADGYQYVQCSEWLADLCRALPDCAAIHFPNYDTRIFEDIIDGNPVVIQLWKGRCDHLGFLPNMPGGVGAEVGVYHRIDGKTLPPSVPAALQPLLLRAAAAAAAVGANLWWPFPELNARIEFELINPRTNETFFRVGPTAGASGYWLSRWMRFTSYDVYKSRHEHPTWASEYWMIARVNGKKYVWGPPELAARGQAMHLAGVTDDGHLWHTIRREDGTWQDFRDVEGAAGERGTLVDVDLQSIGAEVHLCALDSAGGLWHTIRYAAGPWQAFGDVKSQAGNRGAFVKVGVAAIGQALHVCGVTSDGHLWHTIRRADGSWQAFQDVETLAGDRGSFIDIDCAEVNGELHVCGVTSDGHLWHTIRRANGWQPFGDVEGQTGDRGTIRKVACAAVAGELHVCAVASDGRLWHSIRHGGAGAWNAFADVESRAGERGSFVCVSVGELNGLLHVCGVTSDGQLWHTVRAFDGMQVVFMGVSGWQGFGDVEGQAGQRGRFTTVGMDGLIP